MNLSGTWKYSEDHSHGDSEGELILKHKGKKLSGTLIHLETPLEGSSFKVEQQFEGTFNKEDNSIILKATSSKIIQSEEEIIYEFDSFEAQVMNEDLIVGTSEDEQGILGVFTFKRI